MGTKMCQNLYRNRAKTTLENRFLFFLV